MNSQRLRHSGKPIFAIFISLTGLFSIPGFDFVPLTTAAAIPAFNEEKTIAKIIIRAKGQVDMVVVVDDGSQDDTAQIAEALGAVVIRHGKNLGKGAALRDCFEWAKTAGIDILVTLDADGQHDAMQIPVLVNALRTAQADIVIGSRSARPLDMPHHRWVGKRTLDMVTQVKVGERFVDAQSGFRAYSRRAIENMVVAEFGMGADSETIMRAHRAGMKIVEVPMDASYAGLETSSLNPMVHGLDVLFSVVKLISIRHPLAFYGGFSIIAFSVSLIFGLMTLDYYQRWGRVITNLALVSVASGIIAFLALFTAIILFTLITVVRETNAR